MRLDEQTRRDFPILRADRQRPPRSSTSTPRRSSQKPRTVIEAMSQYYETSHANVHRSIHTLGEEATELYELARDRVQRFIGAASREEVVFTRGTTDGLEPGRRGARAGRCGRATRSSSPSSSTTPTSSPGRWSPATAAPSIKAIPITADGALDLDAFERLLDAAHPGGGVRPRLQRARHHHPGRRDLARRARQVGAVTVVDGAQAAPHLPARYVRAGM